MSNEDGVDPGQPPAPGAELIGPVPDRSGVSPGTAADLGDSASGGPGTTTAAGPAAARWRRTTRLLLVPRLRRVDLVVAGLLATLGFAAAVQVQSTRDDGVLAGARQEDLVRILTDVTNRNQRLRQEVASLTATEQRLTTGGDRSAAALAEAQRQTLLLAELAGTVQARGPGVLLTITDPAGKIPAGTLLQALEELRDAGAEAVQLQGQVGAADPGPAVRVIASTALLDGQGGIVVDGVLLRPPYRFTVIGDPSTLASALGIPGGVIDTVARSQGRATVLRPDQVTVAAVRPLAVARYAHPDPSSSAP